MNKAAILQAYPEMMTREVAVRTSQVVTLGITVQRANSAAVEDKSAPVEALEQRQKETLQRLVDGIVWLDRTRI